MNLNINNNFITCPLCKNLFFKSLVRFHYENCKKKNNDLNNVNNSQQNMQNIQNTQINKNDAYRQEILRQNELKRQIELRKQYELQKNRELERQYEMERQKEIYKQYEIQRQKEIQKQKELERYQEIQRLKQLEIQRQQRQQIQQEELERYNQLKKEKEQLELEKYNQLKKEKEQQEKQNEYNEIKKEKEHEQKENKIKKEKEDQQKDHDEKINKKKECQLVNYIRPELTSYNDNVLNHFFQEYDKLFHQYVNGKCIALVGPAESILNTNKGNVIDQFDIVVRLNKSIPVPTKLKDDIGTRTDIVYNSLNTSDFPGENNLSTRLYKKHGIKFVCSSYPFNHTIFHDDIMNYVYKYKFDLPLKVFNDKKFRSLENALGTRPYTGTCAIVDLLSYPIKYLYITGLDFYHSKYYGEYRRMSKEGQKYARNSNIHKAKPQLEYLKNLSFYDNRIILDEFLDKLIYHDYYKVLKHLKSFETDKIFYFGDPNFQKYFEMKMSYCTYTKHNQNINKNNYETPYLIITDNKYYMKNNNEYCLFLNNDKNIINYLNNNLSEKKFIGNFFYTKNNIVPHTMHISDKFLLTIKNNVSRIGISNCNINLAILLAIIFYLPEKHYFSYGEIMNGWKLTNEEKKLVLFLIKKKTLIII